MTLATCRFDQLAEIKLGVKTFLNPFFYVDQATTGRFGIESQYLEPVFRTADAKRDKFTQSSRHTKLQIFLCSQKLDELKGTGAAAYINWASTQRHKGQNGQPGGLWKETPAVKPDERVWYQNQAMPPPARIVLLKAFDEYFSPFILDKAIRVDQRFNQVNPKAGVSEDVLIGLLCSTWFVMLCETYGRTAMGQGVLEVPTNALRGLPVPDVRKLGSADTKTWEAATQALLRAKRLPANKARETKTQRALDSCVLNSLGLSPTRIDELYADVDRMTRVRHLLAAGRGRIRRERFASDVDQVADDIAAQLKSLIAGRRFPNDFLPSGASATPVALGNAPITVTADLMLDRRHVTVDADGTVVYDALLPAATGEVFIRAVEAGQRTFNIPDDEAEAGQALIALDQLVTAASTKLDELSDSAGASVRAALQEKVETRINLPLSRLQKPVGGTYRASF